MSLTRRGSDNITSLSDSSLYVENLSGASLNDLVTISDRSGDSFVGRVVAIEGDSCHIRICDGQHALSREGLQVWLGSSEFMLPAEPPRVASSLTRRSVFKTGIAPIDALFPLQHGQTVFVAGVSLRDSLPLTASLLHGALSDKQVPCLISLDTSKNEEKVIRKMWSGYGLEDDGLYISDSRDQLYQSLTPIRMGFENARRLAQEGRDVFLMLLDLESWFRFYQEDLALRGFFRSRRSALYGFKNQLASHLQLLLGHRGRITLMALLSERKVAGMPAELVALKDLFDVFLPLRRDGTLSLRGYAPLPPRSADREAEYARLLRRQCKELEKQIRRKQMDEYPLSPEEKCFMKKLRLFLGNLQSRESHLSDESIWSVLASLPENRLDLVSLSLLREFGAVSEKEHTR